MSKIESFSRYFQDSANISADVLGNSSGSYAAGDNRVPKILGPLQRRIRFKKKKRRKRKNQKN